MASSPMISGVLWLSVALSLALAARSLDCATPLRGFKNGNAYENCNDLGRLQSFLHWTYDASEHSLSVAFVAPPEKPGGWVAWALNPAGAGMVGAESLVAFRDADGSVAVKPYRLKSYSAIVQENLTFPVTDLSGGFWDGAMSISATVKLPAATRAGSVNHVWQVGGAVTGGVPNKHQFMAPNLNSKGSLDLKSARAVSTGGSDPRLKRKNIHGVLNALSWGILFPVGVIMARYLRAFESADPAWFYLHVSCQSSAYVIGVAGWGTGLKLGSESAGVQYSAHRYMGIALFCLATLQASALLLRPKKDHKYRFAWNMYHHGVGYAVVAMGILNVFVGLHVLSPPNRWRTAYAAVAAVMGSVALVLEAVTWVVVLRRKSSGPTKAVQ